MLDDHRKNRLMELFAEASELAPEQREAFFTRVADEDATVHVELVELLRVVDHDLAGFLSEPAIAAPAMRSAPPPEIAGYVVLEPIGRGGMSTVYRANQLVPARGLAWSVTGHFVTIDASDMLRLFDSTTGKEVASRREPHGPLALAASPVDDLLAVACADQSVWLSSSAGDDRGVLRGHTGHVQAVAFAPDGARLASGARDGTVRLWDVADRAEVACIYGAGIVIAVAFSPDGTRLAALDSTGGLVLWDARPTGRR